MAGGDVTLFLNFSPHRGETVEEQLAEIGQSDGVAAGDALAGELFDEITEEVIHGIGGGEVFELAEKLGGEGFGIRSLLVSLLLPSVLGTETRSGIGGWQAASTIAGGMGAAA
ncbi:MAG: hypothetical protein ACHQLQ_13835 [Candidatus Acidiferrales bacterium]